MSNHSFDADIATEYKSIEVATMVWHFQYWIRKNKALGINQREGRTWSYQTMQEIAACFPYWSFPQVKRLLTKLIELKILIKGNFNKTPLDRTMWYAFKDEEKFTISRIKEMDFPKSENGNDGIGKCYKDTDTLTDALTDKISSLPFGGVALSFYARLKETNPKIKKPNFAKWAKELELLAQDGDGSTLEEIEKVLAYVLSTRSKPSSSGFSWFLVIQSPAALRKHFPKIWAEIDTIKEVKNNPFNNKEIAASIAKKFPRDDIVTGPDYIEFINGMYSNHIKFEDKEFKVKCLSELNKRKLKIEKL